MNMNKEIKRELRDQNRALRQIDKTHTAEIKAAQKAAKYAAANVQKLIKLRTRATASISRRIMILEGRLA
jgi:hypothetical protein